METETAIGGNWYNDLIYFDTDKIMIKNWCWKSETEINLIGKQNKLETEMVTNWNWVKTNKLSQLKQKWGYTSTN